MVPPCHEADLHNIYCTGGGGADFPREFRRTRFQGARQHLNLSGVDIFDVGCRAVRLQKKNDIRVFSGFVFDGVAERITRCVVDGVRKRSKPLSRANRRLMIGIPYFLAPRKVTDSQTIHECQSIQRGNAMKQGESIKSTPTLHCACTYFRGHRIPPTTSSDASSRHL